MNSIIECAKRILLEHPHHALRLTELHELLAERFDRGLEQARLRGMLEEHSRVFRVLDPWRGLWRHPGQPRAALYAADPWVVIVTHPDGAEHSQRPTALTLRESVRWLAHDIDARSAYGGKPVVRDRSGRTSSAQCYPAKGGLKSSERHSPSRSISRQVNPNCSVCSRTPSHS